MEILSSGTIRLQRPEALAGLVIELRNFSGIDLQAIGGEPQIGPDGKWRLSIDLVPYDPPLRLVS